MAVESPKQLSIAEATSAEVLRRVRDARVGGALEAVAHKEIAETVRPFEERGMSVGPLHQV